MRLFSRVSPCRPLFRYLLYLYGVMPLQRQLLKPDERIEIINFLSPNVSKTMACGDCKANLNTLVVSGRIHHASVNVSINNHDL